MHHVSAGVSHLKDFSGASGRFSQRTKSHKTLVGMKAMGKGAGGGSVLPTRADLCSASSVKGDRLGQWEMGGQSSEHKPSCAHHSQQKVSRGQELRELVESQESS